MHWSHWFSHTMNFSLNSNPTVTTRWRWGSQTRARRRRKWSQAPNVLPEPPKKKRRTEKADITSMERIDSYMSNTYLGKMRAAGQIQKAPISRTFFEKTSERRRKRKARRQERRVIRIWLSLGFSLERKNSSGFDETIFLVLKTYLLVFALVSLFRNI